MTETLTPSEYLTLLQERQTAYAARVAAERAAAGLPPLRPWMQPLLEWFVEPGDTALFTPPEEKPQPKRQTTPRVYRSAASLRAERDQLVARRARLGEPILPDRAAAGGKAIGAKGTARVQQREDSRLRRYAALTRRIDALDYRIRRAETREARP